MSILHILRKILFSYADYFFSNIRNISNCELLNRSTSVASLYGEEMFNFQLSFGGSCALGAEGEERSGICQWYLLTG